MFFREPVQHRQCVTLNVSSVLGSLLLLLVVTATPRAANAQQQLVPDIPSKLAGSTRGTLKEHDFYLGCFDTSGHPLANWTITVSNLQHDADTGGHLSQYHPASTAGAVVGTMDLGTGITGANGWLYVHYTMPEAAGTVSFTVTCTAPFPQSGQNSAQVSENAEVDGLVSLSSGQGYVVQGPIPAYHSDNSYVVPGFAALLQEIPANFTQALAYFDLATGQTLQSVTITYTSESLPSGGLFDYNATWAPPHRTHRQGTEADLYVGNLPANLRTFLRAAVLASGLGTPVPGEDPNTLTANHWHVTF